MLKFFTNPVQSIPGLFPGKNQDLHAMYYIGEAALSLINVMIVGLSLKGDCLNLRVSMYIFSYKPECT